MKTGYRVIKNAISAATAELLCLQFEISRNLAYYEKNLDPRDEDKLFSFGDTQVARSYAKYGFIGFEGLLLQMLPVVAEATGKRLLPAYSYGRIYYNGAVMDKHIDRDSCEYSTTMTLSIDEKPWDIWMTDLSGVASPLALGVGDMCVYQGAVLKHWREKYEGKKQVQVFLHYVDADGIHTAFAYDKRPMLGMKGKE